MNMHGVAGALRGRTAEVKCSGDWNPSPGGPVNNYSGNLLPFRPVEWPGN